MVFADLITVKDLLPVAIFGMFAALSWWMMELVAVGKPRSLERLDELKRPRRRDEATALRKADAMTRMLERATPALAKPLEPKNEMEAGKLKLRLAAAGFRGLAATSIFLGLKFAGLLFGLFCGGGLVLGLSGISQKNLGVSVVLAGLCFYLPDMIVWFISRGRKQGIFLGLPDALDLMVVCVEAGLGLDQAMRRVTEEMTKSHPVLSEEFALANFQMQMGKTRSEVLHELGLRTGVADLRSLAAVLIQADKFGSSVAQALRVQSDSMRVRRRQMAEEKAAKTAVKLIFPLVIFIFPGIFVVLVGPAAITMIKDFFPLMESGGL